MVNKELIKFIVEARKRGFSDKEITQPLLGEGWPQQEIDLAFKQINAKSKGKVPITIGIEEEVLRVISRRAKKNLLSVEEQIADIVRRSAVTARGKQLSPEKIDDLLVSIFSRRKRGQHK